MLGEKVEELNVLTNVEYQVQMVDVPGVYFVSAEVGDKTLSSEIIVE